MFSSVQTLIVLVLSYAAFGAGVWALIDAVRRSPSAFVSAGKLTKPLWLGILAAATVILFLTLPYPLGQSVLPLFHMLPLVSIAAVIIYFVGVRPHLGSIGRGRGSKRQNKGGW